ncbi:MAG: hypothetical protein LBD75_07295 [Candidatus Peribacteria bacterium]|nr:hypothetical protein [Candidatus Peribacteria bacterium]
MIFMNTAEVLYVYVGQAGRRNSIK